MSLTRSEISVLVLSVRNLSIAPLKHTLSSSVLTNAASDVMSAIDKCQRQENFLPMKSCATMLPSSMTGACVLIISDTRALLHLLMLFTGQKDLIVWRILFPSMTLVAHWVAAWNVALIFSIGKVILVLGTIDGILFY